MQSTTARRAPSGVRPVVAFAVGVVALIGAGRSASAHQVWIETASTATTAEPHDIQVCWGHSGSKEGGSILARQRDKLTACVAGSQGSKPVALSVAADAFTGQFAPLAGECQTVGAELQSGIIDHELHGIPAHTRIVMYGKACVRPADGSGERGPLLGHELELAAVSKLRDARPGASVTVRVLHKGRPIGGRNVLVSLRTLGDLPAADDARVKTREWAIESTADPATGEVTFPLIVGGQHMFYVRYFDETPGVYQGDRQDSSDFSHLRTGDKFERTMYVATLTMQVAAK